MTSRIMVIGKWTALVVCECVDIKCQLEVLDWDGEIEFEFGADYRPWGWKRLKWAWLALRGKTIPGPGILMKEKTARSLAEFILTNLEKRPSSS